MIILASASPRRQELLGIITKEFEVIPADVDEAFDDALNPREAVEALALKKARAVFEARPDDVIIGADTVVTIGGDVLGKPTDKLHAAEMLGRLSGRTHEAITGVCVLSKSFCEVFSQSTSVTFFEISEREIADYIATGEPFDKAGAYGIQGKGALFVSKIDGDYYNVMGLPVAVLNKIFKKFVVF